MKVIIAGGRHYKLTPQDIAWLDDIRLRLPITEVVSGCATGADTGGYLWADARGIAIEPFPADWDDIDVPGAVIGVRRDGSKYNKLAGYLRNQEMADYADALIAFPGGNGTADMIERATKKGLKVLRVGVMFSGTHKPYFNPLDHEQTK